MASLNLSSNFLERFASTNEPFAVIDGIFYEVHPTYRNQRPRNYFRYLDTYFELVEGEYIKDLEGEFFRDNKPNIHRYIDGMLESHERKHKSAKSRIASLEKSIQQYMDKSIENFITKEVFYFYLSKYSNKVTNPQEINDLLEKNSQLDTAINPSKEFDFSEIIRKSSILSSVLERKNIMAWLGQIFSLEKSRQELNQGLYFKDSHYDLKSHSKLEDLIKNYGGRITKEITSYVEKNNKSYIDLINRLERSTEDLSSIKDKLTLPEGNLARDNVNNTSLGVRLKKREGDRALYEVYLKISPYIIRKGNNDYLFPRLTLSSDVEIKYNKVRLTGKPKIKSPGHYHHPFVHADNSICYNESNVDVFGNLGVTFQPLRTDDPKQRAYAANNIATAFNVARRIFQHGYHGRGFLPVQDLNTTNFSEEYENGSYSRGKQRVYVND